MSSLNLPAKYTTLMPSRWGWFCGLSRDSFQTGSIYLQGEWAPVESSAIRQFIKRGDTVLDVGANVGGLTLGFAAAVGETGSVLSFEPQRYPFFCLCANIALNSVMHYVQPLRVAVGSKLGDIEVPIMDPTIVNNFGGASLLDPHSFPTEKVSLITIDSLNLERCDLIKADVEGMEPDVLAGATQTICKFLPAIWVECLELRDTRAALIEQFKSHEYHSWLVHTPLFSDQNTRLCDQNAFISPAGEAMTDSNILALPNSRDRIPDYLKDFEQLT